MDDRVRIIKLANVLLAVVCALLLVYTFTSPATVHLDLPAGSSLSINGHPYGGDTVTLRPAAYTVEVHSANFRTYKNTFKVSLLPKQQTVRFTLTPRTPSIIVSSVIGSAGQFGPPTVSDVKYFDDQRWLVGVVGPGGANPIALQYVANSWQARYYTAEGYPQDKTALPADIASYITTLENKYAG